MEFRKGNVSSYDSKESRKLVDVVLPSFPTSINYLFRDFNPYDSKDEVG